MANTHWAYDGDSITIGVGASDEGHSYVNLFAALKGLTIVRRAQSGRTLQKVTTTNPDNSMENVFFTPTSDQIANEPRIIYDPMYAGRSIRIGINDVFGREHGGSAATFKSMYQNILDEMYGDGWPANKLYIINIGRYRSDENETNDAVQLFNEKIVELCTDNGIQLLNQYALDEANGTDPVYNDDHTHPNDLGCLKSAQMMDSEINLIPIEPIQILVPHGRFII